MVSRPPSGMASRALMHRLRIAFSSWFGSHSVGQRPIAEHRLDLDRRPDRALDQLLHVGDQLVRVGRLGIERLPAREGQQPMRQRRRTRGSALGGRDIALQIADPALREPRPQQLQAAR